MNVVATQNRKQYHQAERVALFFSIAIGMPLAAIVLVWVGVHGAFPYIRSHINDPDIFPNVAALYWISQTFTLFVIALDILALSKNSQVEEYNMLDHYQLIFLSLLTILEILGLFLSFLLALIPLFSHFKHTNCKVIFQAYFKIICCSVVSFKQVGRKEARVWLLLNSLLIPVTAVLSHAGFIIGGWVSYEDRSLAISLLYFCIFVLLYWSLQYMYKFSTVVFNRIQASYSKRHVHKHGTYYVDHESGLEECDTGELKKSLCIPNPPLEEQEAIPRNRAFTDETAATIKKEGENHHHEEDLADNIETTKQNHHEEDLANNIQTTKQIGFDTVALFLMLFPLSFLYTIISYFGLGLALPLLSSIDKALVHIFTLGQYGVAIAIFLLTYKLFSIKSGSGAQRLISNDALRYWRYLNKESHVKYPVFALRRSIEILLLTLKCLKMDERNLYIYLLKKKVFDLEIVSDRIQRAVKYFKRLEKEETDRIGCGNIWNSCRERRTRTEQAELSKDQLAGLREAAEKFEKAAVKDMELKKFEECIQPLQESVEAIKDERYLTSQEQKAIKKLCEGINHFRKMLVSVVGVPPMYLNRDKASALTAALLYQKINTFQPPEPKRCHSLEPGQTAEPGQAAKHGQTAKPEQTAEPVPTAEARSTAEPDESDSQRPEEQQHSPDNKDRYSLLLALIEEEF